MKRTIVSFVGAIISALIGVIGTVIIYKTQTEMSHIDVYVDPKTSIIAMSGDEIRNYGKLTVSLFNYSDRDLSNVEFYLDLGRKDGSKIDVKRINYSGKSGVKELVDELPVITPSSNSAVRNKFRVTTANRTDYDQTFFSIDYIIDGAVAVDQMDVNIISLTKGVEVRNFNIDHIPRRVKETRRAWIFVPLASIVLVMFIFLVVFPMSAFFTRPMDAKLRRIFSGEIYSALQNHQAFKNTSEDAKKALARDLAYLQRKNYFESKSKLYRYIFGLNEPVRDDFSVIDVPLNTTNKTPT